MIEEKPHIDQNALSRQLAVYGYEVQAKLMAMRVYIHGITGLGIEVAKNLILAGPKQVTIYDPNTVVLADMGRNFYITQEHIGNMARAQASLKELKELNPNVKVNLSDNNEIEKITSQNECVVVLDCYDKNYLINLNKACREKNVGFIYAGNLGLYGFAFVDYGDKHKVLDPTGEQEKSVHIAGITKQPEGVVFLHKKHGLCDDDTLFFRQVQGMTQINGQQYKIKVISPDSFSIGDTTQFSDYVSGGIATEVKVPIFQQFYSLQKSLAYPYAPGTRELPIANWEHFGYPEQLHVILNGLLNFWGKHKRLPSNLSKEDSTELLTLTKQWLQNKIDEEGFEFKVNKIDQNLVRNVSFFSQTQISPVCSFWGGIITQQIIKLTGKYTPLRQWLHHEYFEILQSNHHVSCEEEVKLTYLNTRYADYNILFGDEFIKKAAQSRTFLIGAGALGCEFIKMFALMGFSTENEGKVICTDDDNIEISNLNRQFLFRKHHVGRNKSEVACSIGHQINNSCKFKSVKLKVSPEAEQYFNDEFWQGMDLIVNAVDNIKARQFIDNQCVWYEKPLFESGTLGTKCHSQIIIPHFTASYNDIKDPPEEEFAVCTLKLFPYQIEHTIQWAREYFQTVIAIPTQDLKDFYENKTSFVEKLLRQNKKNPTIAKQRLERVKRVHEVNESHSYQKCVEIAARIFEEAFQNQIAQLLYAFPEDYINPQSGKPYWSGLKRLPTVLKLSTQDRLHVEFIQATANIFAAAFNIPQHKDPNQVKQHISKIKPIEFVPKKVKQPQQKQGQNEKVDAVQFTEQDENEIKKIKDDLLKIETQKYQPPNAVVFEKDDPTNWHIEFMGGVSNLRARNYRINEVDNFKVKLIAGKIIPAIATTTALIVGSVGLQIIKYLLIKDQKQIKQGYFKNITVNLALPLFVLNDPLLAIKKVDKEMDIEMGGPIKVVPHPFTKWDKIQVHGPKTLEELKKEFETEYQIEISAIMHKAATLYPSYKKIPNANKQRLKLTVEQAIEEVTQKKISKDKKSIPLQISNSTKDGVDCLLPLIKYYI